MKKVKYIGKIVEGALLLTADLVVMYPSISHEPGLETLTKGFNERERSKTLTEDKVQITEFVSKIITLSLILEVWKQKSWKSIGIKFAHPVIYIDTNELKFLKVESWNLFNGFDISTTNFCMNWNMETFCIDHISAGEESFCYALAA